MTATATFAFRQNTVTIGIHAVEQFFAHGVIFSAGNQAIAIGVQTRTFFAKATFAFAFSLGPTFAHLLADG